MTFEEIITKAQMNKDFRKQLREMVQVSSGQKSAVFAKQDVQGVTIQGYVLERALLFMTSDDFAAENGGMRPKEAGIREETLVDETGSKVCGIILQDESSKLRKLRVYGGWHVQLDEEVHKGDQQLRADQGSEVFDWYLQEACKKLPKGIAKPSSAWTVEELKKHVAEKKEQRELAQSQKPFQIIEQPTAEEKVIRSDKPLLEADVSSGEEEDDGEDPEPKRPRINVQSMRLRRKTCVSPKSKPATKKRKAEDIVGAGSGGSGAARADVRAGSSKLARRQALPLHLFSAMTLQPSSLFSV